jgi:antitoxin component YwqK of YwqJK toxin-antitoxin module
MWRGNYFHGELHGVWEWYWEDGIIWLKEKYHHGINYGLKIIYSFEEHGRLHKKIYLANIK